MTEYYVSGCIEKDGNCETCADDAAQFWTLYERDEKGESQAVADFTDKHSANAVWQRLDNMEAAALAMRDLWREDQQQVNALAAENANMRNAIDQTIGWQESVDPDNVESVRLLVALSTPATDAIKRKWMAEDVAEFTTHFLQQIEIADLADDEKVSVAEVKAAVEHSMSQLRQPEGKGHE